ncbi:MAG: tetratricopeptide repeat protein [Candidatus Heimdallarchaeota archaeon]
MVDAVSNGLHHLEQLLYEGKFPEAFDLVKHLENQFDLHSTDQLQVQFLKSELMRRLGQFRKALAIAEEVLKDSQQLIEPLYGIDALLVKMKITLSFLQIPETSNVIEQIGELLPLLSKTTVADINPRKATLVWGKAHYHLLKNDQDRALVLAQESLGLRQELRNKAAIADSLHVIGSIFYSKGKLNRSMEYYQRSLTLREEIGNKQDIASSLNALGRIYFLNDNFQKASEYLELSLAIHREIGNKLLINNVLENLGWMARYRGELNLALRYYNQLREYAEEIGFPTHFSIFHIGLIHGLQGEPDLALEYMEQSITEVRKSFGRTYGFAWSLNRLAKLYREKGDSEQAIKHLMESLAISEEFQETYSFRLVMSETLFYLFSIALDQNFPNRASEYLKYLEKLTEQHAPSSEGSDLITHRCRVAQALLLKTSPRIKDKARAQELLHQVVNEEKVDHDLAVMALLILCELFLLELQMSGAQEVLDEVKAFTRRLLMIAKQQPSFWLLAETYVLKSRLALFELDLQSTSQFLDQALLLAEEKGLKRLAVKIYSEQNQFRDQMEHWERLIKQKAPPSERLELAQLESLIRRMANRQLEITEEETLAYAQRAQELVKGWENK